MICCKKVCSRHTCNLCGRVVNPDTEKRLSDNVRLTIIALGANSTYMECKNYYIKTYGKIKNENYFRSYLSNFKSIAFKKRNKRLRSKIVLDDLLKLKKAVKEFGGIEFFEHRMNFIDDLVGVIK